MPLAFRMRHHWPGRYRLEGQTTRYAYTGRPATQLWRPAPDPGPTPGTRRIVCGSYANSQFVSTQLKKEWRTRANATTYVAGDHLDAAGVQNGTTNYATFTVTGAGVFITLDSVAHPGLVTLFNNLLAENTGIHLRKVSGSHPCGFHQGSAANPPVLTLTNVAGAVYTPTLVHGRGFLGNTSDIRAPAFMRWNLSGVVGPIASVSLRLYVSAFYGNITIGINLLDPPFVDALPFVAVPGTLPPNISDVDLSSEASIRADVNDEVAPPYTYNPSHFRDEVYDVDVLRAGFLTTNQRSIRWKHNITPAQEVYMAVAHKFESAMWDAQNEEGLKLVSLGDLAPSGNYMYAGLEITMTRSTHDEENRGLWGLVGYNMRNGVAQTDKNVAFCVLESDRWYHMEFRVKMNTYPASDGQYEVWVNGNKVYELRDIIWVGVQQGAVEQLQWQLYHGGMGLPASQFWVNCAKFQASTTRIGVPIEFLGEQYPAWRQGKTKDTLYAISGTSLATQTAEKGLNLAGTPGASYASALDNFTGIGTTANAQYTLANGGHNYGNGTNVVLKLDYSQSTPQWSVVNPTSPLSAIPGMVENSTLAYTHANDGPGVYDGKPLAAHTYYVTQWVPSHNKMLRFTGPAIWAANTFTYYGIDAFDLTSHEWSAKGTYPNLGSLPGALFVACVARDPRNDDIYYVNSTNARRWRADAGPVGSVETISLASVNNSFSAMLVDPARSRLVIIRDGSATYWDIGNRSLGVAGSGARTVAAISGVGSDRFTQEVPALYDPDNDRYIALHYRQSTQTNPLTEVWAINPDTWAATLLASNEVGSPAYNPALPYVRLDRERPYNKMAYLADYKCVVYVAHYDANVVFIPTV